MEMNYWYVFEGRLIWWDVPSTAGGGCPPAVKNEKMQFRRGMITHPETLIYPPLEQGPRELAKGQEKIQERRRRRSRGEGRGGAGREIGGRKCWGAIPASRQEATR